MTKHALTEHTERSSREAIGGAARVVYTSTICYLSCSTCLWASNRHFIDRHLVFDPPAIEAFWQGLRDQHQAQVVARA